MDGGSSRESESGDSESMTNSFCPSDCEARGAWRGDRSDGNDGIPDP